MSTFFYFFENPMISKIRKRVIPPPRVILKVLTWGVVITTLIKAVTLSYIISNILIISIINISSKRIFPTTLRAGIARTSTSVSLK